jgi:hypothetical protein
VKLKNIVSTLLMAGALGVSGIASAAPIFWYGTVQDWINGGGTLADTLLPANQPSHSGNTIIDDDGDMSFTWTETKSNGDLGLNGVLAGSEQWIDVVMQEVEIGGKDIYTIGFDFNNTDSLSPFFAAGGYSDNGGVFKYDITALGSELISSVALDSTTVGNVGETVTMALSDLNALNPFLTLNSLNGATVPTAGHINFGARQSISVVNTLNKNGGAGIITHVDNEFNVPEPMSIYMLSIGLAALAYGRRKTTVAGGLLA